MSDSTKSETRRMPIFAISSIAAVLLGYLLRSLLRYQREGLWIGLCDGSGLILAVASIFRREKPSALSWSALLLSLAVYIVLFIAVG